jgi:hypothetical protein
VSKSERERARKKERKREREREKAREKARERERERDREREVREREREREREKKRDHSLGLGAVSHVGHAAELRDGFTQVHPLAFLFVYIHGRLGGAVLGCINMEDY